MKLEFDKMEAKALENFKGGEGVFHMHSFNDGLIAINDIHIEPGTYNGMHKHLQNCEVIYVIEGELIIQNDDGTEEIVGPGEVTYCAEGNGHSVICGSKPTHMIGIVTEHHM